MKLSELKNQLETLIDSNSLSIVIEALSLVCYEKESHINENWQDKQTANTWKHAGNKLAAIADKISC